MKYSIGVDIGGTKVAIAAVDQYGGILNKAIIPTDLTISPEGMISKINLEIEQVLTKANLPLEQCIGIGIGTPGPLDSKNGIITNPPNLKSWVNVPLKQLVEQHFQLKVVLENDANAAALAEKWIGAATNNDNFIYITISTGIGAGIFTDGRLMRGRKGNAGDIGHIVIDPSFGKCTCGQDGCLESIASGTAIAKRGTDIVGSKVTTKEIFALYEEGHSGIVSFVEKVFRVLGIACVTMINTFDPEKIVLGGGVTKVGEPLFEAIRNYVCEFALNETGRNTEIVPAKLEQNAGVIGAAALCYDVE